MTPSMIESSDDIVGVTCVFDFLFISAYVYIKEKMRGQNVYLCICQANMDVFDVFVVVLFFFGFIEEVKIIGFPTVIAAAI